MLENIRGTTTGKVTPLIGRDFFTNLYSMIGQAERSIIFTVFQSSSSVLKQNSKTARLLNRIHEAYESGIDVRIVINRPHKNSPIATANKYLVDFLKSSGIPYRLGKATDMIHAKFYVIDYRVLIVGSHNFTDAGLWSNHEASVAVESESAALTYVSYFNHLWSLGRDEVS